jgi:hypothetical protein
MKIDLIHGAADDTSFPQVIIRAEGVAEILELRKYLGRDRQPADVDKVVEWAQHLTEEIAAGSLVTVLHSNADHAWVQVDVDLPTALDPYVHALEDLFGVYPRFLEQDRFDIPLAAGRASQGMGMLCPTRITREMYIEGGSLKATVLFNAPRKGWHIYDMQGYAEHYVPDLVQEAVGARKHEPEYAQRGNVFCRNPDYLKRHRAHVALTNERLFDILAQDVLTHQASDAQKNVLGRALTKVSLMRFAQGMETLYVKDAAGTCDWDGKGTKARVWTREDFRKLVGTGE